MKFQFLISVASIFPQVISGKTFENAIFKKHHHSGESIGDCYNILVEGYKECDELCSIEMTCDDSEEFEKAMAECEICTQGKESSHEECVEACFENHPEGDDETVAIDNMWEDVPQVLFLSKILSGEATLDSAEKEMQKLKKFAPTKSVARSLDTVLVKKEDDDDATPTNFAQCYQDLVSGLADCDEDCSQSAPCDVSSSDFWVHVFNCNTCTFDATFDMYTCLWNCIDIDDTTDDTDDDTTDYGSM
jgi:hypothetical protein